MKMTISRRKKDRSHLTWWDIACQICHIVIPCDMNQLCKHWKWQEKQKDVVVGCVRPGISYQTSDYLIIKGLLCDMSQRCKQWRRRGRQQWEPSWFCRSHCFCCSHRMLTIITCDNSKFLWWWSPITIQIWWSTTSLHVGMIIKADD